MQILYDAKTDLLYLRLDDGTQAVVNKRLSEDIVLDWSIRGSTEKNVRMINYGPLATYI